MSPFCHISTLYSVFFPLANNFIEFDYLYTRAARKSTGSRAPRGFRSVVAPGDLNFSIGALSDDDDDGERPGFGGDFEVNMDDFVPTLSLGGGAVDLGAAPAQAETNAPSDSDFTQTYEDLCRAKIVRLSSSYIHFADICALGIVSVERAAV